jgi:uncharacterized protein YlxW (UPF0749 family)
MATTRPSLLLLTTRAPLLQTKMVQTQMSQTKRGYLNISLPVHREDTIYTYLEGLKHLQSKIAGLRHAVEELGALVKEKDGVIQRLERELMHKEGVIQKLKAVGPGVEMGSERVERIKRADVMMELMGVMSDREREAYDPL